MYDNMFQSSQNAEKLRTPRGDYWIKQWFSSIAPHFKMGNSFKEKNLLMVPYGIINHFSHWVTSLECQYFITHVRNSVMELRQCVLSIKIAL